MPESGPHGTAGELGAAGDAGDAAGEQPAAPEGRTHGLGHLGPPHPPRPPRGLPPLPHGLPPLKHLSALPPASEWTVPRREDGTLEPLGLHAFAAGVVGVTVTLIWAATGQGSFWPVWVWFGLAITFTLHGLAERTQAVPGRAQRLYVVHEGIVAITTGIVLAIWLLAPGGGFWPAWPVGGLLATLALHHAVREPPPPPATEALTARVDELTRSRSGALDVQAAELRRIERDLHDGAQARLVALSMQLGRAEQRLGPDADEQTRALIKGAQEDARLAIAELRDLARGIAPPVLVDRGLAAAADALGKRSPLEVEVLADVRRRPATVVESAAYFVIAEALTNAAKHSPGASVRVTIVADDERLQVAIADDGVGGADTSGGGLIGLRQRVGALDGTLTVVSPEGHGTTIVAELPCGL